MLVLSTNRRHGNGIMNFGLAEALCNELLVPSSDRREALTVGHDDTHEVSPLHLEKKLRACQESRGILIEVRRMAEFIHFFRSPQEAINIASEETEGEEANGREDGEAAADIGGDREHRNALLDTKIS